MNFLGIQVSLVRMCSSSWGRYVVKYSVWSGTSTCHLDNVLLLSVHIIGLRETFTSAKLRRQAWDGSRSGIMHTSRLLRQTEGTIQCWCCLSCDKTLGSVAAAHNWTLIYIKNTSSKIMLSFGVSERKLSFLPHLLGTYWLYIKSRFFPSLQLDRQVCLFTVVFTIALFQSLNINERWNSIVRALLSTEVTAVDIFQSLFSSIYSNRNNALWYEMSISHCWWRHPELLLKNGILDKRHRGATHKWVRYLWQIILLSCKL